MFVGGSIGSCRKPEVMDSVGADLYRGEFEESVVKRIFEYGKVEALAVYYRVVECKNRLACISKAYAIVYICAIDRSYGILFLTERYQTLVGLGNIDLAASNDTGLSPVYKSTIFIFYGFAAFRAYYSVELGKYGNLYKQYEPQKCK